MAYNHEYHKHDHEIISLWEQHSGEIQKRDIAKRLLGNSATEREIDNFRIYISKLINSDHDKEIIKENVRFAKGIQKQQDLNRIKNKSFREDARLENAVSAFAEEIRNQNKLFGKELSKFKLKTHKHKTGGTGVLQLSDIHFNEEINLPHNKYNFEVAAKRLKKHVTESLAYFKFKGVSKVLIAFTGDCLNSNRREDEYLNQTTNRAKATVLAVHILKQLIMDVRKDFPVSIVGILGNESRSSINMSFSNEALSDNYDFTILAQLHQMFEFSKIKDVNFLSYQNAEEIVKIEDMKWLIAHNLSKMVDNQKEAQSTVGRYSVAGNKIDFIIGGHIHATNIGPMYARSGSLPGSNSYNEVALGLAGKSQQNCFTVNGKTISVQVNNLDDTDDIKDGYEIISQLEAYNTKSTSKLKQPKTILQIVI